MGHLAVLTAIGAGSVGLYWPWRRDIDLALVNTAAAQQVDGEARY